MLQQHPGAARAAHRRRDGAARRHRRGAAGHFARRTDAPVRERRPFAPRRLQRHARRSGRHGAHPRPDRVHDDARHRRSGKERQAQEAFAGRARPQGGRSRHAAVGGPDHAADPVRAAVDAGDGPARPDAGDAHSSGAGDRRIRRHRRPGVDRGHRRGDRRRDRRRARRGRDAGGRATAGRLLHRRRARQSRRRRRAWSAAISTSATQRRRSTRWAAIW